MEDAGPPVAKATDTRDEMSFMNWLKKNKIAGSISAAILAGVILLLIEDVLAGRARGEQLAALADNLEKVEARAAEDRREAAARAADALEKAEARAAEDRREANEHFRQVNQLLLTLSKQGVENAVKIEIIERQLSDQ